MGDTRGFICSFWSQRFAFSRVSERQAGLISVADRVIRLKAESQPMIHVPGASMMEEGHGDSR